VSYIVDTDILIYFLKNHPIVVEHFSGHSLSELATTRVNATELLYGAHNSSSPSRSLLIHRSLLKELVVYEFGEAASEVFASEKARLKKQGNLIEDMDILIASICIVESKILVTNNTKHFQRISGLKIENWSID
jgi:predicted nucleic acid-binding protein